jgi:Spy/CpxP family protein refolding chaperone
MFDWWRHARRAAYGCGASAGCGPSGYDSREGYDWETRHAAPDHDGDFGGGPFNVRRPLRFLAHKLDLDDKQVSELAAILSDLKTERAQAAVDHRRSTAAFADTVASEKFDETKAQSVAGERVKTAERLRDAVVKALGRIHALLTAEQREKLAYLIRTGALTL